MQDGSKLDILLFGMGVFSRSVNLHANIKLQKGISLKILKNHGNVKMALYAFRLGMKSSETGIDVNCINVAQLRPQHYANIYTVAKLLCIS